MLSDRPRNIIVGLTFLAALAVCMYGIILLGKFPIFANLNQYKITLIAPNANGVGTGSRVELNGVPAGQVTSVYLSADAATGKLIARVEMQINSQISIPANATASLQRPSAVGNPIVALYATDAKGPKLATDGSAVLSASAADSGLIPKEIIDDINVAKDVVKDKFGPAAEQLGSAARELALVAKQLQVMLAYTTPEAVAGADPNDPNRPRANITTVVIRIDRIAESMQKLLTDPQVQGNVRDAIQNIADASGQLRTTLQKLNTAADSANGAMSAIGGAATRASATLDTTQKEIFRVTDQLVVTLSSLDKSIKQITDGNGTTGKLITDPRLYEGLLDLSKSLKKSADDLDFLLNKWKDEGVNLRLK